MSKTRKILSIMLVLAMMVSTFAISANAAAAYEAEEDATKYNQTWALSEPVDNGDGTYTVEVNLKTDYETGAIQFVLTNTDATAVQFVSPADDEKAILPGGAIPAAYNADISALEVVDEETNTSYVKVMIIPTTEAGGIIAPVAIDGVIAKVKYKLVSGSADITLENDAASSINPAGSLIAARVTDGNIVTGTMVVGQTAAIKEGQGTVTIGALSSDLAKKSGAEAGIIIDKTHTFNSAYDGVVFGFTMVAPSTFMTTTYITNNLEATNGGTLTFSRSIGKTGYGTGTVITVTGKDGGVKNYVVVIFGDVDGSGMININDTKAVQTAVNVASTYANNSVQRMAANCQNIAAPALQHILNINDTKAVQAHVNGTKIDQAALAAKLAANTQYYL